MTEHRISLAGLAAKYAVPHAAHHVFSPSGSWLWLNCPGGLIPNLLAPDDSGFDAAYGTVGHGVGELWLKTGKKPRHLIGEVEWVKNGGRIYEVEIDEDMLDHVQRYVDWCAVLPGAHFVETHVEFSQYTPLPYQGGTSDHAAARFRHLTITDLKLGKGVKKNAEGNPQLMLYALGFFIRYDELYDFQQIELRIAQPRMNHMDTHTISRAELLEFAERVRIGSHAAWQVDAPRKPSIDACEFCRVKATCGAHLAFQAELTQGAFEPVDIDEDDVLALKERIEDGEVFNHAKLMTLSTEEMARLLPFRGFVEGWWKALDTELKRRFANREEIPGYKAVEGRSRRFFKNPKVAGERLVAAGCEEADVFPRKIVSPAQSETLLRKAGVKGVDLQEVLGGLIDKRPDRPTLVPLSDKRPAIVDMSEDAFRDEDQTENDETEETEN